jgi:UDP-N-acetylmuramyl pentapeptide synthase
MNKARFLIALWAAKVSRLLLKILGRNATLFPGKIAVKLYPAFLKYVSKPERIIAVTGTNGKTTVCNLLMMFWKRRL